MPPSIEGSDDQNVYDTVMKHVHALLQKMWRINGKRGTRVEIGLPEILWFAFLAGVRARCIGGVLPNEYILDRQLVPTVSGLMYGPPCKLDASIFLNVGPGSVVVRWDR